MTIDFETARSQWQGLVEAPDGSAGGALGQIGITTPNLSFDKVARANAQEAQNARDTSSSEGGLNDQLFFTNANGVVAEIASSHQQSASNEFWLNSNPALAADRHAIDANPDTGLTTKNTSFLEGVVDEGRSEETAVIQYGATINDSTISVANLDVSADPSTKGGDWTMPDLNVFDNKKLSPILFKSLPGLSVQGNGFISPSPLFNTAPSLGQSENQQGQRVLQHNFSFGSQTVPTDRNLVNNSEVFSVQPSALSLEQLALLNQAIITIVDLADGHLALTSGTTITLNTDAAWYLVVRRSDAVHE